MSKETTEISAAPKLEPKLENDIPEEKETISLNLSSGVVENIDEFIHRAKKELPLKKRKRLYRATFIELLLDAIFDDYLRQEKQSFVWKLVKNWGETE